MTSGFMLCWAICLLPSCSFPIMLSEIRNGSYCHELSIHSLLSPVEICLFSLDKGSATWCKVHPSWLSTQQASRIWMRRSWTWGLPQRLVVKHSCGHAWAPCFYFYKSTLSSQNEERKRTQQLMYSPRQGLLVKEGARSFGKRDVWAVFLFNTTNFPVFNENVFILYEVFAGVESQAPPYYQSIFSLHLWNIPSFSSCPCYSASANLTSSPWSLPTLLDFVFLFRVLKTNKTKQNENQKESPSWS